MMKSIGKPQDNQNNNNENRTKNENHCETNGTHLKIQC